MKIVISSLSLENFKGASMVHYTFDGRSAAIYGANGSGKSTIYDAWLWLLTGKDSSGSVDFKIKPVDPNGVVLDHAARSSVEAEILADGKHMTLRREYFERWSKKRGNPEAAFDGNATEFFINGVPKSKGDYEAALDALLDRDLLRLLSDNTAFAKLHWKKRRDILFELADVGTDLELMEENDAYAPLLEAAASVGLDDLRTSLKAKRKKINSRLNDLPIAISENNRAAQELQGLQFDALRDSEADLQETEHQLTSELAETRSGDIAALSNRVKEIEISLQELDLQNKQYRGALTEAAPPDERPAVEDKISFLERRIREEEQWFADKCKYYQSLKERAAQIASETEGYRAEYTSISEMKFNGADCPTCGRPMEGSMLEEAKKNFEARKQDRLDVIAQRGKKAVKDQNSNAERMEAVKDRIVEIESEIAQMKDELASEKAYLSSLGAYSAPEITDMPDYAEKRSGLTKRLTAARNELKQAQLSSDELMSSIRSKRNAVRDELASIRSQLAKEATLQTLERRIEQLQQERHDLAQELAEIDRISDLAESFSKFKATYITDRINGKFRLAQFQLFAEQVNGGVADTCDILCGGVPYDSGLNSSAKINVGLDIIRTLSDWYGASVPVFIDNAESVTQLEDMACQTIRLTVSEDDEKVRVVLL